MANIPNIRFKGYTEPWERRKLGDISNSYSGGTPSVGVKEYYGGDIPFIRSAEINSEFTELFITEKGLNSSSARYVNPGDILYAMYGATSGEVGRARLKGAINQAILAIKPHLNYDSEFITQWLKKSKKTIVDTYLQGGQGNLSGTIVKELLIEFPNYAEQQKIGDYFRNLDNLITLHQSKCNDMKKLKKYMLQKMFPKKNENVPEIRFEGFGEPWEQRKFGDVFIERREKSEIENEDALLSCAISGMYLNTELFSHQRGQSNIGYIKVKKGDLILSAQNLHLGNANVNLRFEHGIISPAYKVYESVSCDPNFSQAWVKQDKTKDYFLSATTEGASVCRKNVVWEWLYSQPFYLPEYIEQTKIGAFFKQLDNLITLHQSKCDEMKEIKKFMLNNMFPRKG